MPLGNKFRRLAVLMEPEILRMRERYAQRTAGNDDARHDARSGTIFFVRNGATTWQPQAEKIGEWTADVALFKWWFAGFAFGEHGHTRLDPAHAEGKLYQLPELTTDTVTVESMDDAKLVAHVAAQICRADGVFEVRRGETTTFFAVFDVQDARASDIAGLRDTNVTVGAPVPEWTAWGPPQLRKNAPYSVAPPALHDPARAPSAARSLPPPRFIDVAPDDWDRIPAVQRAPNVPTLSGHAPPPPSARPQAPPPTMPVREPRREIFMPVAQCALGDVAAAAPGFAQAMVVVRVEIANGTKGRFFVQLVALDARGDLVALDPSRALLDAAARMIAEDSRDGNGRWAKLAARLKPTDRGAAVDVEIA